MCQCPPRFTRENRMGRLLNIVTPLHKADQARLPRAHGGRQGPLHAARPRNTSSTTGTATAATATAATSSSTGRWKPVAQALIDTYGLNGQLEDPRRRLRQGVPALRDQAAPARHCTVAGFDISQHGLADAREEVQAAPVPLPRAGPLSVRRQVLRPRDLARARCTTCALFELQTALQRDRARRQEQIHHGRELPQRARAVQSRVLGADRGVVLRHRRVDLALQPLRLSPATTSSSIFE